MSEHPELEVERVREVITEPTSGHAGVAVSYCERPAHHETKVTVEQLWDGGTAEPVWVGDEDDALALIGALAELIRA